MSDKRKGIPTDDPQVVQIPVAFSTEGDTPVVRKIEDWDTSAGCRHRAVMVCEKTRTVKCQHCDVAVDPIAALLDVGLWIRKQEYRYDEMRREDRKRQLAAQVRLARVKPSAKYGSIHGNLIGYGGDSKTGMPKVALAVGDYADHRYRYRVRKVGAVYETAFWDPEHGLKVLATLARPTLAQARTAVRDHWFRWNQNRPKS